MDSARNDDGRPTTTPDAHDDSAGQQHDHESGSVNTPESLALGDLPQRLQDAVQRAGWTELMNVQSRSLPFLLAGRDMMVQSRTGSGKTGAYLLPLLERINPRHASCQVLVLVPTRELARQVLAEADVLFADTPIRTVALYGGVGYGPQLSALEKGAHLVVGTPGRVLDHLMRRTLRLRDLQVLIFDEADRMLSIGFYPDMRRVQDFLPNNGLSSWMFSATFPPQVLRLAQEFLIDPEFLSLSRDHVHVTDVDHVYYLTPAMDKDRALVRIIELQNPESALIFCNTKAKVHYVSVVLQRFGFNADELSSDLSQSARNHVLERLRRNRLRFLVATDVAARGIDVPELSHVFLYELPDSPEDYIHRAGRTGRAGATGEVITLVSRAERGKLMGIAHQYSIDLQERDLPSDADLAKANSERAAVLLESRLRERDKLQIERMQRFTEFVKEITSSEEGIDLLAMLVDDFFHKAVHTSQTQAGPVTPARIEPSAQQSSGQRRHRRPRRRHG